MRSRRGIELINRFASDELVRRGSERDGRPDRPLPRRLHPAAAPRDRVPARLGRPARGGRHRRARARDRRRRARRRDLRQLPRNRREPPADVGAGRAGSRRGLAVYVAGEDALDQFFCRHPDEFLERPVEAAILDHRSEQIQMQHLLAAAYEAPLGPDDDEILGEGWRERAERMVTDGRAPARAGRALPDPHGRFRRQPDLAALCLRRQRRGHRLLLGGDARQRRGRAGLLDRSTQARSTSTWGAPTRSRSWTWARGARSSGRSRATTTPR